MYWAIGVLDSFFIGIEFDIGLGAVLFVLRKNFRQAAHGREESRRYWVLDNA